MAAPVEIRPMTSDDVDASDAVAREVLSAPAAGESEAARRRRAHARIAHLLDTDPGGAWVAEHDGRVVGLALALIRERVWGLSLFGVAAAFQGRGIGRRLLDASRRYGDRADGHLILSSEHPAAMRRYARLGLPLRPCVSAAGIVARATAPALDGVEDAGEAGIPVADAIGRAVRGAGHGRDLPLPLAHGARLLVFEDRAFAVVRGGDVMLVAARDEAAATKVLWAALTAGPPGVTMRVDFLTAGQDWAVHACLDAGLALSPDGPLFAGGRLGPLRPYLPSGAYL